MCPTKTAQKQTKLAQAAIDNPEYKFANLYSLMHWRPWIENAAQRVLARPGSSTAGVDGVTRWTFERNYEKEINGLIESLKRKTYEPRPVSRTYIPKSEGRKRPLGIPVLRDRIVQEALRAILDPIYESDFQHHSYGFRKGRCTMDAVVVLMPLFNNQGKFYCIIEGDIRSYFDNVHHRKLMSILRRRIKDRAVLTLIWKFLKAGVMEGPLFAKTENGVPQGGVISPLLANVYLNQFDKWAEERWHTLTPYQRKRRRSNGLGNHIMVRYADDFVVVSNGPITQVREVKEQIKEYLTSELHLELSEEKTRITHVNDGFDFLGFHIQRVKSKGRWAVHLRPTEENKRRVKRKLKELTSKKWIWLDEYARLTTLNWIVRGWCEYYRYTSLLSDLEEITRYTWFRYFAWLLKKHEGSRKKRLIRSKTAKRYNRTRWKAEVREGDKALTTYQWLPTRTELKRQRYPKKGRDGFLHPYLDETPLETDYPIGEVGPSDSVYKEVIKIVAVTNHSPGWPSKRLRVKMRDDFQCTQCGSRVNLQVHRIKAKESERIEDLMTLCQECHTAETSRRKKYLMESPLRLTAHGGFGGGSGGNTPREIGTVRRRSYPTNAKKRTGGELGA